MRTVVELENSNCTWCHHQTLAALRRRQWVQQVRSDFSTGCLEIEHRDNPGALVSLIKATDRAVALAANGEKVMIQVDAHASAQCSR